MKKQFLLLLILSCLVCCLMISCGKNDGASDRPKDSWEVAFVYNANNSSVIYVKDGDRVSMPADPVKKNYVFLGWFSNYACTERYDFSEEVHSDLTLYAKFELDAGKITNEISQNAMKSIVKIECQYYNEILWGMLETDKTGWYLGSGFCFSENDGYYYILTNCHVVEGPSGYDKMRIRVTDYKGNQYTAQLYTNPSKNKEAKSAEYDLACIYFKSGSTEVKPLEILRTNPKLQDDVISLGTPDGQTNTITFGKVKEYKTITLDDTPKNESNVTFDVIRHNADIKGGSSGGPLLNSNLDVVGVNYAGSTGDNDISYAIPAEKIWEFLNTYVYN